MIDLHLTIQHQLRSLTCGRIDHIEFAEISMCNDQLRTVIRSDDAVAIESFGQIFEIAGQRNGLTGRRVGQVALWRERQLIHVRQTGIGKVDDIIGQSDIVDKPLGIGRELDVRRQLAGQPIIDQRIAGFGAGYVEQVGAPIIGQARHSLCLLRRNKDAAFACEQVDLVDGPRSNGADKSGVTSANGDSFWLETVGQHHDRGHGLRGLGLRSLWCFDRCLRLRIGALGWRRLAAGQQQGEQTDNDQYSVDKSTGHGILLQYVL